MFRSCVYHVTFPAGKEVAVYCANKMGEMIKSTEAYKKGDMAWALKDAFVDCDKKLLLPEVSKELKRIANDNRAEEKCVVRMCALLYILYTYLIDYLLIHTHTQTVFNFVPMMTNLYFFTCSQKIGLETTLKHTMTHTHTCTVTQLQKISMS